MVAASLTFESAALCLAGATLGTAIGVLPGIGTMAALGMLIPLTFSMSPVGAVLFLAGIYLGAQYGGATSAILLNLPGTPTAIATTWDGHPLAQQGLAGQALILTMVASFVAGVIGVAMTLLLATSLSAIALTFGPGEYAALLLLCLVAASAASNALPVASVAAVLLGMLLGAVGVDTATGIARFSGDLAMLADGVPLLPFVLGMFGVPEVARWLATPQAKLTLHWPGWWRMWPTKQQWCQSVAPILRGTGVGALFGALPGTGGVSATYSAYALEKRLSSTPERFGRGAIAGVVAPEAANNAAAQTAFVPTLTLGVPGDVVMVLFLSALTLHGLTPGPALIREDPALFETLIVGFLLANVWLLLLNVPMLGLWVRLAALPASWLLPLVTAFLLLAAYLDSGVFGVVVLALAGVLGAVLRRLAMPPALVVLGMVLGPTLEEHTRRWYLLLQAEPTMLWQRPWPLVLLLAAAALGYFGYRHRA